MEKNDQIRIAEEIIKGFSEEFLASVVLIPENWDGFEIRQLAVDWMNENYTVHNAHDFGNKRGKRRKDYENFKFTNNLI